MTMKAILLFVLSVLTISASAQQYEIRGTLADTAGKAVSSAAVTLLDPADSTMAYFGVSNGTGQFKISSVKGGNYLLQIASIGYRMQYRPLHVPISGDNDLG